MQNKIEQYQELLWQFLRCLQDVKFAGQVVFVIIVLLISWSGIKAIQTNYDLQKQITAQKQQNQLQSLRNNNLALENEYYNTDTYLDLAARQNFGLAAPGEKEVLVPVDVARSYTVPLPAQPTTTDQPTDKQPVWQRNYQAWVNFFMHREQPTG
ncbi:MAG TPA: septum formation initiator family protein [Candidatus Saccharimonadales bacterium]|nr:septum formation initiator family protein [Candidatus Saccharimonadales bacterium]